MKIEDLKHDIKRQIYGSGYLETHFLDSYLEAFYDGAPRSDVPRVTGNLVWTEIRVHEKLLGDGYLKRYDNTGFVITSSGKIHIDKGGYKAELLQNRLLKATTILSLILSLIALFRTF